MNRLVDLSCIKLRMSVYVGLFLCQLTSFACEDSTISKIDFIYSLVVSQKLEEAKIALLKDIPIFELSKEKCPWASAHGHYLMGRYYQINRKDDSAVVEYFLSLPLMESLVKKSSQDSATIAKTYNNLSILYGERSGAWKISMELALKGLSLREDIAGTPGIEFVHLNLGTIFYNLKNFDNALHHIKKFLTLSMQKGDDYSLARAHNSICRIYSALGNLDSAQYHFERGKFYAETSKNTNILVLCYQNYGEALLLNGNLLEAKKNFEVGLKLIETQNQVNNSTKAYLFSSFGKTLEELHMFNKAIELNRRGIKLFNSISNETLKRDFLENISNSFEKLGNKDSAYKYQKALAQLSLKVQDNLSKILAYEAVYALEAFENEKQILAKETKEAKSRLFIQYLISGILILVLILIGLAYFQYVQKVKFEKSIKFHLGEADRRVSRAIIETYKEEQRSLKKERNELGKILHETIQGQISIGKMLIQNIDEALNYNNENLEMQMQIVQESLEVSMKNVREISHKLQEGLPYNINYHGNLIKEIKRILAPYRNGNIFKNLYFQVANSQDEAKNNFRPLDYSIKRDLLLWIQGGLTNIVKHGGYVTTVNVQLVFHFNYLRVSIKDDGKGFQEPSDYLISNSTGLKRIKQEVENYGGTFLLSSELNKGVSFEIKVPLGEREVNFYQI